MKTKFYTTAESGHTNRRGLKNLNENSMFNVKNVSLMKKQVFKLMMLLALIVGVGGSASAQVSGDALTPTTAGIVAVGAKLSLSIIPDKSGNTITWSIFEVGSTADMGTETTSSSGTKVKSIASLTDTTAAGMANDTLYAWFKAAPETDMVYCIQVLEEDEDNSCTTRRRLFFSVFDFEVTIQIADASAAEYGDNQSWCNSWSGDVVLNNIDEDNAAELHADSINNLTANEYKLDTLYFTVNFSLTSPPAGLAMNDFKWLMKFDAPDTLNANIFKIYRVGSESDSPAGFASEYDAPSENDTIAASDFESVLSISNSAGYAANNTIYFDEFGDGTQTVGEWLFAVVIHNLLGDDDQVYDWQAVYAMLEFDYAGSTSYNDGAKTANGAGTGEAEFANAQSYTNTVTQSPATTIIQIND